MTTTTTNLNLVLYNSDSDQSGSFLTWQNDMSGSNNSNMIKIDNWSGSMSGSIVTLNSNASGSLTVISGSITTLSGSITTMNSDIATQYLKIGKINESILSASGIIDFDNIPQTYTHLLVVGVASAGGTTPNFTTLSCDFNGDANTSNYSEFQWKKFVYNSISQELFYEFPALRGSLPLAQIPSPKTGSYVGPVLALIPNYSANGGTYKNAMSLISAYYDTNYYYNEMFVSTAGGGVWLSTVPITRIRIFRTTDGSTRYNLAINTKISLYGIG